MSRHKEFDFDRLPQGQQGLLRAADEGAGSDRSGRRRSDDLRRHDYAGRDI